MIESHGEDEARQGGQRSQRGTAVGVMARALPGCAVPCQRRAARRQRRHSEGAGMCAAPVAHEERTQSRGDDSAPGGGHAARPPACSPPAVAWRRTTAPGGSRLSVSRGCPGGAAAAGEAPRIAHRPQQTGAVLAQPAWRLSWPRCGAWPSPTVLRTPTFNCSAKATPSARATLAAQSQFVALHPPRPPRCVTHPCCVAP